MGFYLRKYYRNVRVPRKEEINEGRRNLYNFWREEALSKFGRVCTNCGFSDVRALQFDHIAGGGRKEKRNTGMGYTYYRMLAKDETGKYTLLCANCNLIKARELNQFGARTASTEK